MTTITHDEWKKRDAARQKAAHDACYLGNPKNKAWFERWEREFRHRWVERGGKFYPADYEVKP
jgi:hypothetical protein